MDNHSVQEEFQDQGSCRSFIYNPNWALQCESLKAASICYKDGGRKEGEERKDKGQKRKQRVQAEKGSFREWVEKCKRAKGEDL